ncbi:MAG TPA: hypothetical protein VGC46_06505 [Allosphingosinicella sp.]
MTLGSSLIALVASMMQPPAAEEQTPPHTPPPTEAEQPPEVEPPANTEGLGEDQRRRPGVPQEALEQPVQQVNPGAIRSPPPEAFPTDHMPIPDRWRLIDTIGFARENYLDPYNQNTLKGDRPICTPSLRDQQDEAGERHRRTLGCRIFDTLGLGGDDWFFVGSAVSDTVLEPRSFPIPVGVQTTNRPGSNDVFGIGDSLVAAQTVILSAALIKGNTAYRPPTVEYRLTLAAQMNYVDVSERRVLFVEPSRGTSRLDTWIGVQEAFIDYHFRDVSDRYDFDSIRVGIQPLQFDFRGFLFNDQNLAVRLFGNRDNNRWQYNLIGVWRLEKDTNSGLNDITASPRNDWIVHANVFRQDLPIVGLTSEASLTWNINREGQDVHIDDNGFPVRPALFGDLRGRNYDAIYLGYNADGRIGRINLSASLSYVFGWEQHNVFTGRPADISGYFAAFEPSYDFNWIRLRGAAMISSGDADPYNDTHAAYDAIFENPIFAGADTSYWIRQTIPFAGGARAVSINGRNGILANLRSSKEEGQSNFVNPGTLLLGVGADLDITPDFRLSGNANHLWFHRTEVLEALRVEGTIPNEIGFDISAAAIYRPNFNQNLVFRASAAALIPTAGFNDLFTNEGRHDFYYSILLNAILTY